MHMRLPVRVHGCVDCCVRREGQERERGLLFASVEYRKQAELAMSCTLCMSALAWSQFASEVLVTLAPT